METTITHEKIQIPSPKKEEALFEDCIVGQPAAVHDFALLYTSLLSNVRSSQPGPRDSIFLAGPSGVGKTEMTLTLADLLAKTNADNSGKSKVIIVNGAEFQQEEYISRLIGSPPGYAGSAFTPGYIQPVFSQKNIDNNRIRFKGKDGEVKSVTIVLVDEAEKANEALHRVFLSILDKGEIQMANNQKVDMSDVVVLFTSNIGNQEIEKSIKKGDIDINDQDVKKKIIDEAIGKKFPPELRGRIREFVIFEHLESDDLAKIVEKQINNVYADFEKNGVKFKMTIDYKAINWLAKKGYNSSEGARATKKIIQKTIFHNLLLINNEFGLNGKSIHVRVDEGESDPDLDFYWNNEPSKSPITKEIISNPHRDAVEWAMVHKLSMLATGSSKDFLDSQIFGVTPNKILIINPNKINNKIEDALVVVKNLNQIAIDNHVETPEEFERLVLTPIIKDRLSEKAKNPYKCTRTERDKIEEQLWAH